MIVILMVQKKLFLVCQGIVIPRSVLMQIQVLLLLLMILILKLQSVYNFGVIATDAAGKVLSNQSLKY